MTEYQKLVRDNIPKIIRQDGKTPITHTAGDEEYRSKLLEKLTEEVEEYKQSPSPEELADILEVVYALGQTFGLSGTQLEKLRQKKAKTRGGFFQRIILERIE